MTRRPHRQRPESLQHYPIRSTSPARDLVFALAVMGLLVAVSYPVYALAVVGTVAAAVALFRLGAPRLARELHGRMTEFDVPGIGTVQIRVGGR